MNTQLVYFCQGLKCNGEILFALKHCAFILLNKATALDQHTFIEYIGRLCNAWALCESGEDWTGTFVEEYRGHLHNGYNVKVKWSSDALEITIITNDIIALLYKFQFESELFTRSILLYRSSYNMIKLRVTRFDYADDLKSLLMSDLNGCKKYNKYEEFMNTIAWYAKHITRYDLFNAVFREFTWVNIIYGIFLVYMGNTRNLSYLTDLGILLIVLTLVWFPVKAVQWNQCAQCKKD